MGYPEEVSEFQMDIQAYQRGLVIDKKRGNMLKLDRHKYVKVGTRGTLTTPDIISTAFVGSRVGG